LVHIMRNNIGYPNKNSNMTGVDTMFNTWDLGITPAAKDFASITDPSVSMTGVAVESSGALGPRAADGSMPAVDFLKLAAGSQMIDKGTDVGLPFVGAAPDLGAYEYGAATTTGTGGTSATGGSTGTGGAGTGGAGTGGSPATGTGGGAGGTAGSRGTGGSAGRAGTGGAPGTGGNTTTGTGGRTTDDAGVGPTTGAGGNTTTGTGGTGPIGTGGASATGGPGAESSSGCSCTFDDPSGSASTGSALAMLGAFSFLLLTRRRRRATARL